MTIITEDTLRSITIKQSFERGREYYHSGAIYNAIHQGNTLLADCEGTSAYHLHVELDEGGIQSASCTCSYELSGYCKHIIALLLTYIHQPGRFSERKSLSVLLENVDKTALVAILTKLTDRHPELYNWLETTLPPVAGVAVTPAAPRPKRDSDVSEQVYRKRIKNILHPSSRYGYDEYGSTFGITGELDGVTNVAEELLKTDDAQGAIIILTTLLDELADAYEMFDDSDGDLGDTADSAGALLAEAILSADLTDQERKTLEYKIKPIAKNLAEYGIEDGFGVVQLALQYGWNEPQDGNAAFTADLTEAKLNVLERQGQVDNFLSFCQQTGRYLRCVLKLLQLGRIEEALETANQQLEVPGEILAAAKAIRQVGRLQDAILLAERGVKTNSPNHHHLAAWLAPLEEAQGRIEPALRAYLADFAAMPAIETYKSIQRLSGERWAQLKPAQMKILLQSGSSDAIVSIYLYEQEWDQAIKIVEKNSYDYNLREKVADAVITHRTDWVIQISIQEAEKLIAPTQSKYYSHAVRWLAKAKQAYLQAGRKADWLTYFTQLKATYARRPSLQKELVKL